MASNPNIALQVQQPRVGEGIVALAGIRRQNMERQAQDQAMAKQNELTDLRIKGAKSELNEQQMKGVSMAAASIQPMLESGDTKGALTFLKGRMATLEADGRDPSDTAEMIQAIESGDLQNAMSANKAIINYGINAGWLAAPEKEEGFTLSEGQSRFDAQGNPIASVDKPAKAPETRTIKDGSKTITQEFDPANNQWKQIASSDEVEISRQKETDKQAAKDRLTEEKIKLQDQSKQIKAAIVTGKVDDAIKLVDQLGTTGFVGQILSSFGGTDARNLQTTLDTIKANLGFSELQAMRDASPTGGALGQVTVREIELLQSTIASLDQAQDDATLKNNLKAIKVHMQNWKNAVDASLEDMQENQSPEAEDALINKYLQ